MNRDETIKVMNEIKNLKPNYFNSFTKEQKQKLVDNWTDELIDYDLSLVLSSTIEFISENNKVPYPTDISEILRKDDWKQYTVSDGNRILYGDALIHFIGLKNWSDVISDDVLDQMEYDPSVNDEEWTFKRNEALKIALEIQGMLRG